MRAVARLLVGVFYRRIEVVGAERLPARGPVIVAANHQNSMVDPMLVLAAAERPLVPIAKAPLFRHPLIGPFLRLVGAIPVHRRIDAGGSDPTDNAEMFRHAVQGLAAGRALLIFPEGASQPHPRLLPLRTGAARMLLAAETMSEDGVGVRLVPAGLVYHDPGRFRTGRALVVFGDPVDVADCVRLYSSDPPEAVRRLTDRLAERLRMLIVDAGDRDTLRLLDVLETTARDGPAPTADEAGRAAWMRQAMRAYRWFIANDPVRVTGFRQRVERYAKNLEMAGLRRHRRIPQGGAQAVWRRAAGDAAALLVGLPLAVIGVALNGVPYWLTRLAMRVVPHERDEAATYAIGAGMVFFPLGWAAEAWVGWRLAGGIGLAALLAALPPSAFFALGWRDRLVSFRTDARVLLRLLRDPRLAARLDVERRALLDEMTAIARDVPEDVLSASAAPDEPESREEDGARPGSR